MSSEDGAREHGFLVGQGWRWAGVARVKETMEGFGYTAAETDGSWNHVITFRPRSQPTQVWQFGYMGFAWPDPPIGRKIQDVRIRAAGFLSSAGDYGKCDGYSYDHMFFATSISLIADN